MGTNPPNPPSHSTSDAKLLTASGVDSVLEPFQDAADRAVELLSGGEMFERTPIPLIASEETDSP